MKKKAKAKAIKPPDPPDDTWIPLVVVIMTLLFACFVVAVSKGLLDAPPSPY